MAHSILLAVRPDERATATLETAAWLARDLGASITLLYVAVELSTAPQVANATGIAEDAARERMLEEVMRQIEALVRKRLAGLDITVQVEEGDIVERIMAVAAATGASLLVVGTHGRTAASRLVLGDITDDVLKAAPCPVVVVPRPRGPSEA
ncbi:MAG TPA: universal stress protein [Longimicrobiales bacterium]|nr:universal stress protein [Longimicrobiales bacterium]